MHRHGARCSPTDFHSRPSVVVWEQASEPVPALVAHIPLVRVLALAVALAQGSPLEEESDWESMLASVAL